MTGPTQTWLLLLPDGSHTTIGRYAKPAVEHIDDCMRAIARHGLPGGWIVRMEGDYHRPRSQLAMHQLATLAAPGIPYNDALAKFLQRRARSNASASTADTI